MYPGSAAHRNPTNPRSTYDTGAAGADDQYAGYQQQGAGFSNVGNVNSYSYGSNMK
jgi:hypothetical protein